MSRSLNEPLDDRVMAGFGGVAEYGITVRWDKNFLKIIRLLLERRDRVRAVRRRALRRHARLPTARSRWASITSRSPPARASRRCSNCRTASRNGVRTASDFLMALQLTGAAKTDSLANMQVRLPVVVVGGGLTAIDTATESLAYYPVQVEKFLARYEALVAEKGREAVEAAWTPRGARDRRRSSSTHARAIRAERRSRRARRTARRAHRRAAARSGAASTIAYRRRLIDSPSYTLNHEEVEKALEEGIRFAEGLTPLGDRSRCARPRVARSTVSQHHNDGDGVWHEFGRATLPARTILIAAGTQPNTVLAREDAAHFQLDGKYFRLLDEDGQPVNARQGPRQAGACPPC